MILQIQRYKKEQQTITSNFYANASSYLQDFLFWIKIFITLWNPIQYCKIWFPNRLVASEKYNAFAKLHYKPYCFWLDAISIQNPLYHYSSVKPCLPRINAKRSATYLFSLPLVELTCAIRESSAICSPLFSSVIIGACVYRVPNRTQSTKSADNTKEHVDALNSLGL